MTNFAFLTALDSFFWGYIAFVLIIVLGSILSLKARLFQIRAFPSIVKTFFSFLRKSSNKEEGVNSRGMHPLKAFLPLLGA